MSGRSYLTERDVEQIHQEQRNALATRLALQDPPVAIVLYRQHQGSGNFEPLPAQTVLVRFFSQRQALERRTDAAVGQFAGGSFTREEPFDVAVGDAFTLPNGQTGTIDIVAMPSGGIARATWSLDVGAVS